MPLDVAVFSTCDAEDIPVVLRILEHFPDARIYHAKFHRHKGTATRWARWWKGGVQRRMAGFLYPDGKTPSLNELGIAHSVVEPAEKAANTVWAAELRTDPPDVLVTCGAPMLKKSTFTIPRYGAVNLHWGLVQGYRGADSPFWAMYHGDWSHIGITLHTMNSGVDAGTILAQGAPALEPGDCEAKVWAKLATVAADLAVAYLHSLDVDDAFVIGSGFNPSTPGREFRYGQRRWHHDILETVRRRVRPMEPTEPWRKYHFTTNGYAPTGKECMTLFA